MTTQSLLLAALRGAIVFGLALAAMPLLRHASAATRRAVLVVAFAAVALLPIATTLLPTLHVRGAATPADPPALATPSIAEPVSQTATLGVPPPSAVITSSASAPDPGAVWPPSPATLVIALWALGALVVLAGLGVGLVRARTIARSARLVEVRTLPNGRAVEIRASAALDTPAVTGLFAPVILVPRDADTWTAERRELVIAHELAHAARRDCLASALAQLAVALHWFDPLAWLAARRLRIERELAADDRVLDGGATPSTYAHHLLALATVHAPSRGQVPMGALAMAEPAQLAVRIRALLAPDHSRTPLGRVRFALLGSCGLAITMLVACATPEREPAPPAIPDASARPAPSGDTGAAAIQAIADEEIDRLVGEWKPRAAVVVIVDPATGAVLATASRSTTGAAPTALRAYVTGSTLKPFVVAAALEAGAITTTERFAIDGGETTYHGMTIHDASAHQELDVAGILAVSSNVGAVKIFDKLGGAKLAASLQRFHLADASLSIEDGSTRGAAIAIGEGLPATPVQLALAFAALANGGTYRAPGRTPERVVSATTAREVLALLEGVTGDTGTGKAARIPGVRVGGKTGTASLGAKDTREYYASFVGTAPLDRPRYVVLVGAEAARDGGTGGQVAAPAFARIMSRLLARS